MDEMQIISRKVRDALEAGMFIKLDLGAGSTPRPGFVSVDISPGPSIDIIADLNEGLPLLPDSSVSEVYSRHTFEHIDNLERLLVDLARICVSGARITVVVPHFSNTFAYSDPTHKRFFGIYSFSYYSRTPYFDRSNQLPEYRPGLNLKIDRVALKFYRSMILDRVVSYVMERIVNKFPAAMEFYERRLCFLWPAWEIEFQLTVP